MTAEAKAAVVEAADRLLLGEWEVLGVNTNPAPSLLPIAAGASPFVYPQTYGAVPDEQLHSDGTIANASSVLIAEGATVPCELTQDFDRGFVLPTKSPGEIVKRLDEHCDAEPERRTPVWKRLPGRAPSRRRQGSPRPAGQEPAGSRR